LNHARQTKEHGGQFEEWSYSIHSSIRVDHSRPAYGSGVDVHGSASARRFSFETSVLARDKSAFDAPEQRERMVIVLPALKHTCHGPAYTTFG
jgi:hypothetical protein